MRGREDGSRELWADVDGKIVPAALAQVSAWDRGFLFGDAVFEAVRIHRGRPVLWDVHMQRLLASARGVRFETLPDPDDLLRRARVLVDKSALDSGTLYIQVTRGNSWRRTDNRMPDTPTTFLALDEHASLPEETYTAGVAAITFEDIRWRRADLKTTNLLPRTLARIEANSLGAHEALFTGVDGRVFEGTSTNVFVFKDGVLSTPPLSDRLLPGATRATVLSLGTRVAREVREADVYVQDMLDADEVMLCGTTTEVLGVVSLDGASIGRGVVGPVAVELRRLYRREVLK